MNKFSIIIPCYNVEKFLERCLDSIYNQSYDLFEVIIINDGSFDNTEEIIKKYMNKYDNIKYLKQENKGLANVRNTAIDLVGGNKFIYVDADDLIMPELLENLNNFLTQNDVDIVRYQANCIDEYGNNRNKYMNPNFDILSGKEAIEFFISNKVKYGPVWLYCYDTEFFKNNNFKFIEGKIHEDFYNIYIISKAKSVGNLNYIGYTYIRNSQSITATKNKEQEIKRMKDILYVYDEVIKLLKESYKYNIEEYNKVVQSSSKFLDVGLKRLTDEDRGYYEKEVILRKTLKC